MRGIITGALATVLVSSAALAATTPAKKKQDTTKAKAQAMAPASAQAPVLQAQNDAANEQASSEASSGSEMSQPATVDYGSDATAEGTSSANISEELEKKQPKRKWGGELYSEVNLGASSFRDKTYSPESTSYVAAKYSIAEGQSISVKQLVDYSWSSDPAKASEAHVGDTYLQYLNSKLAQFGETGSLTAILRLYAPTGERSRFITKTRGSLYAALSAGASVGHFDVSYNVIGTVYNQSQNYYFTDNGPMQTAAATFTQYAEGVYNISDKWSITQDLGTSGAYMNALPEDTMHARHKFVSYSYLNYQPTSKVLLALGLYNEVPLTNSGTPFQVMRMDEMTYAAIMQLQL